MRVFTLTPTFFAIFLSRADRRCNCAPPARGAQRCTAVQVHRRRCVAVRMAVRVCTAGGALGRPCVARCARCCPHSQLRNKNQTNHGVRSTASWRLEAVGTIITYDRLNEYITADP